MSLESANVLVKERWSDIYSGQMWTSYIIHLLFTISKNPQIHDFFVEH